MCMFTTPNPLHMSMNVCIKQLLRTRESVCIELQLESVL